MFDPLLAVEHSTPEREAAQAALNGVLGDHLADTANPLSISMCLRRNGRPLRLEKECLAEALVPTGRLAVLVHGLCLSDLQWKRHGHDHGAALAELRDVSRLTLLESFRCVRLVLWDETQRRLLSFRHLQARRLMGEG